MKGIVANTPKGMPTGATQSGLREAVHGAEGELVRYLPHLNRMSEQLKQTSAQIESSVVEVCGSFQGIAERATQTVARTKGFLGQESDGSSDKRSFDGVLQSCSETLIKILKATEESGEVAKRAVERIRQMEKASQSINSAMQQLEQIAKGNTILALNARIEAARAGSHGAGFSVVAMEVISQTERSQKVNAQVGELVANLRGLAGSTLDDLQTMNEQGQQRMAQCRQEVDESLRALQSAHGEMKEMLTGMTEEGAILASDIGSAVRGLQFQDRVSQRIAHVVEDLETIHSRLTAKLGPLGDAETASDEGFSTYTMREERAVAGMEEAEASHGDVELF